MEDKLVIALVVTMTLGAHLWLYQWVRFKIDEGTIIKFLEEDATRSSHHAQTIASTTAIPVKRVSAVCNKSKHIKESTTTEGAWRSRRSEN